MEIVAYYGNDVMCIDINGEIAFFSSKRYQDMYINSKYEPTAHQKLIKPKELYFTNDTVSSCTELCTIIDNIYYFFTYNFHVGNAIAIFEEDEINLTEYNLYIIDGI